MTQKPKKKTTFSPSTRRLLMSKRDAFGKVLSKIVDDNPGIDFEVAIERAGKKLAAPKVAATKKRNLGLIRKAKSVIPKMKNKAGGRKK